MTRRMAGRTRVTAGDRHQSNSLVLEDGRVLGIDFGHAFGSATFMLPIPELVPFRMTPQVGRRVRYRFDVLLQFMGVLYPVDAKGSMKHTMARVLRTLRDSRSTLLHVLSMFVKDPVLAKDDDARKCMKVRCKEETTTLRHVTQIVEDKLNGQNPFAVLKEDIGRNATLRRESLQEPIYKLVDRVRGDNEMWKRDKLNAFEQVDALLHIATSRDILARSALLALLAFQVLGLRQRLLQSLQRMETLRLGAS
eukprot:754083-Hanusia_phi.AAC.5